jgi:hypothetical protein
MHHGDRHVLCPTPSISGRKYVIDANIKGRYNFVIEYIHIPLFFININSYVCVVR